jgi:phage repressor protein C with HTH and peptisase S24 domain
MEQGERPPSAELLFALACEFDVDLKALLCGVAASHARPPEALEVAAQVRPVIRAAADTLADLPQEGLADDYLAVPLVEGRVAAGPGGVVWEKVKSLVWVYRPALGRKHRLIAVRVGGSSMEPNIPDGAIVIIDLDQWQPNGERRRIWALRTEDGDTQIKRLHRLDGGFIVMSDNALDFPPEMAWTGDLRRLVIGRVIWMWRSLE